MRVSLGSRGPISGVQIWKSYGEQSKEESDVQELRIGRPGQITWT
jgi:hypothetical protein